MSSLIIEENQSLKTFSTLGIGGPARFFTTVTSINELKQALAFAKKESLPFLIIGKGSNCLFDDKGINGLVILNKIDFISWKESRICVGAGYSFSLLGVQTARKGFAGLEFASGIPGTVGGAIFMNAGANGQETCEVLESVQYIDEEGNFFDRSITELNFAYRSSSFQKMKVAIVSAQFALQKDSGAREKQIDIVKYRINTQPYGDKSAGCVFRNPKDHSAGSLIEKSGLKGIRVGGAKVSECHANFLINRGEAAAKDMVELARLVEKQVHEKTGITLEWEMRIIPYDLSC